MVLQIILVFRNTFSTAEPFSEYENERKYHKCTIIENFACGKTMLENVFLFLLIMSLWNFNEI